MRHISLKNVCVTAGSRPPEKWRTSLLLNRIIRFLLIHHLIAIIPCLLIWQLSSACPPQAWLARRLSCPSSFLPAVFVADWRAWHRSHCCFHVFSYSTQETTTPKSPSTIGAIVLFRLLFAQHFKYKAVKTVILRHIFPAQLNIAVPAELNLPRITPEPGIPI